VRHPAPPRHQLAQHGQLATRQVARTLELEEGRARLLVRPPRALQQAELLARPLHAPHPLELRRHPVLQLQQVERVLRRVVQHVRRERPHRPVGALVLLVQLHAEEPLQQRGQAERRVAQQLRRDPRVEDVAHLPAVVLLQQPQVVVGIVEHHFDIRVLEHVAEQLRLPDGYRIDHRVTRPRGELEQVDPIDVAVEARPFRVERQLATLRDLLHEPLHRGHGIEVDELFGARAICHSGSSAYCTVGGTDPAVM